jgi:hypothetical protein
MAMSANLFNIVMVSETLVANSNNTNSPSEFINLTAAGMVGCLASVTLE